MSSDLRRVTRALLSVSGEGMDPVNVRVNGQVREMTDVPVAAASLPAGTILGPDDVHMARIGTANLHNEVVRRMDKAVGLQLARPVQAGQPLVSSELTRPLLVRQGMLVRLRLVSAGLSVTGRAVALGSAAHGERVKVRNPGSKIELEGTVIGPELVQIEPGAQPGAVLSRGSTVFDQ